jgi:hypothetical protein
MPLPPTRLRSIQIFTIFNNLLIQNGLEQLYGLDPMTMALLAQQNSAAGTDYSAAILAAQFQQKASDPTQIHQQQQIIQHQQQIQMLYQQQQAVTGGVESTGR